MRRGNRDFVADAAFVSKAHARGLSEIAGPTTSGSGGGPSSSPSREFVLQAAIESAAVESKRPGRGRLVPAAAVQHLADDVPLDLGEVAAQRDGNGVGIAARNGRADRLDDLRRPISSRSASTAACATTLANWRMFPGQLYSNRHCTASSLKRHTPWSPRRAQKELADARKASARPRTSWGRCRSGGDVDRHDVEIIVEPREERTSRDRRRQVGGGRGDGRTSTRPASPPSAPRRRPCWRTSSSRAWAQSGSSPTLSRKRVRLGLAQQAAGGRFARPAASIRVSARVRIAPRPAGNAHERTARSPTLPVNLPGDHFLARVRLAADQHRSVGGCAAAGHVEDFAHRLAAGDDPLACRHAIAVEEASADPAAPVVGRTELRVPCAPTPCERPRAAIPARPALQAAAPRRDRRWAAAGWPPAVADDDEAEERLNRSRAANQFIAGVDPISPGHQHVYALAFQQRQSVLGATDDGHAKAIMGEALAHELVNHGVAVDDEDMRVIHRLIPEIGTILVQKREGL